MAKQDQRVELRVNDEFLNMVDELAGVDGNRADVIRKALGLYAHAVEREKNGRKLGFFVSEEGIDKVEEVVNMGVPLGSL